jgi:hypothetical protein
MLTENDSDLTVKVWFLNPYMPLIVKVWFLNPYMPEVEIFEFVHIHICYLENFKEQEFEKTKKLLYSTVAL